MRFSTTIFGFTVASSAMAAPSVLGQYGAGQTQASAAPVLAAQTAASLAVAIPSPVPIRQISDGQIQYPAGPPANASPATPPVAPLAVPPVAPLSAPPVAPLSAPPVAPLSAPPVASLAAPPVAPTAAFLVTPLVAPPAPAPTASIAVLAASLDTSQGGFAPSSTAQLPRVIPSQPIAPLVVTSQSAPHFTPLVFTSGPADSVLPVFTGAANAVVGNAAGFGLAAFVVAMVG